MPKSDERWDRPLTPAERSKLARAMPGQLVMPSARALIEELRAEADRPFEPFLSTSPLAPPEQPRADERPYGWAELLTDAREIAVAHGVDVGEFWNLTHAELREVVRTRAGAEARKLLATVALLTSLPALERCEPTSNRVALSLSDLQRGASSKEPQSPPVLGWGDAETWYQERVRELRAAGRRSTRGEDRVAAKQERVPMKMVDELRRQYAPAEWQNQGSLPKSAKK